MRTLSADWFLGNPGVPVVGKVTLKPKAIAKSHRPTRIFSQKTCPIIGVRASGELLIEVTPDGLDRLEAEVGRGRTNAHEHNLSTIGAIAAYGERDVLTEDAERKLREADLSRPVKVELFTFSDPKTNERVRKAFEDIVAATHCCLEGERLYSTSLTLYRLKCPTWEALRALQSFRPIRRISYFPIYRPGGAYRAVVPEELTNVELGPRPEAEYPVVAVVDSGIPPGHTRLGPWVVARECYVPDAYLNEEHGVLVAGVLTHCHILEPSRQDGLRGCRLLDVCVMPNSDSDRGLTDDLDEWTLLDRLEDAVAKHSKEVRVWNLSMSSDEVCNDCSVSDLAAKLDWMADHYGVIFVVAGGNLKPPFHVATPQGGGRITVPADTVRGVSVGSIAGRSGDGAVVREYEPSPFSRRGPGPSLIVKPDLVHFGGNCTSTGDCAGMGVRSWDLGGMVTECLGTSFAAPRVSRLLAGIASSLVTPPSNNLVKALAVHSALMPGELRRPAGDELHYYGFGIPGDIQNCLSCTESSVTLVWESDIASGTVFSVDDFPYPMSLRRSLKWTGEVWMTLAYDPPLNRADGFEYCRLNLAASLGVHDQHGVYQGKVPPEAGWGERYEKDLIEHGFKWSPVKVYHKRFTRGISGDNWRLLLTPLQRSGDNSPVVQQFALVVTIADPDGEVDVYSDVVQQLQARFTVSDLEIRPRVRASLGL